MIINRPSIYIYTNEPNQSVLREIFSGIEEEGVFYEIIEREENNLDKLAWDAANDSMLGSGIGIKGVNTAFQMRGIECGKNIISYFNPTPEESRKMGTNSARAIKKQAFK